MFRKYREKSPYFLAMMDFGYTLLAAVGLFGYIGYRLDQRWNSSPWCLLGGIGLGMAVGFNSLFRKLNSLEGRAKRTATRPKREDSDPRS
jgi:F0F1-type ATP synthase assembly protein I